MTIDTNVRLYWIPTQKAPCIANTQNEETAVYDSEKGLYIAKERPHLMFANTPVTYEGQIEAFRNYLRKEGSDPNLAERMLRIVGYYTDTENRSLLTPGNRLVLRRIDVNREVHHPSFNHFPLLIEATEMTAERFEARKPELEYMARSQ